MNASSFEGRIMMLYMNNNAKASQSTNGIELCFTTRCATMHSTNRNHLSEGSVTYHRRAHVLSYPTLGTP